MKTTTLLIIGFAFIALGTCEPGVAHMRRVGDYSERNNPALRTTGDRRRRSTDEEEDVAAFNVRIDKEEIENMIDDFEDFGDRYLKKTRPERLGLMKKLTEAYRNSAAKLILNFGKTIPPVAESWAQVMRHIQVNP